jgi:3-deoxy-D-manno-octulosonic-acid transferase
VVMGPHTFNFAEAAEAALREGAALRAANMLSAIETAVALVQDTQARTLQSERAQSFAAQHGGATQRTAKAVRQWLIKD